MQRGISSRGVRGISRRFDLHDGETIWTILPRKSRCSATKRCNTRFQILNGSSSDPEAATTHGGMPRGAPNPDQHIQRAISFKSFWLSQVLIDCNKSRTAFMRFSLPGASSRVPKPANLRANTRKQTLKCETPCWKSSTNRSL